MRGASDSPADPPPDTKGRDPIVPSRILDGRQAERKSTRRPSPTPDKPHTFTGLGFAVIAAACVVAYALLALSVIWVVISIMIWWAS